MPSPAEHHGDVLTRKDRWTVIDCTPCGFRHITPLPTEEELREVYEHEYYSIEKPLYLERVREDLPWWNRLYAERLAAIGDTRTSAGRRLLDVGSGPGFLLRFAKDHGWDPVGIEPSRQAAEHARGLGVEVIEAFLDDRLVNELGTFDAIHLAEVLEHLPDPRGMVERCRELLVPGGALCVSVPNDYNPFQRLLVERGLQEPWWVAPPHHLNYFDFDSLERLLADAGLEVRARETSFPIDMFLLMGEDYVGDDERGRRCHGMRMRFEETLERAGRADLKRELYGAFASLGLGRLAVVHARR